MSEVVSKHLPETILVVAIIVLWIVFIFKKEKRDGEKR